MRDQSRKSLSETKRIALIAIAIGVIVLFTLASVFVSGEDTAKLAKRKSSVNIEESIIGPNGASWEEIKLRSKLESSKRDLKEFYSRRAYPGAPPVIPHEIDKGNEAIPGNCLACHQNGEYSPKFKAYAPKTPHPQYVNCQQCHVPEGKSFFRPSGWKKPKGPELNQKGLRSSPPVMPHELSLRENCAACHTGPSAPKEIRTTHPERINCIQCHGIMPTPQFEEFKREAK
jgi:nitrate reductase cytochrome c-type subunit